MAPALAHALLEARSAPRRSGRTFRAFACLAALAMAVVALKLGFLGRGVVSAWRALTREELTLKARQFVTGVPVAQDDMRLVVGELDLNQSAQGESSKRRLGLDLGTTKVWLTVPARVHYAVDLSRRDAVEFRVDEAGRFVAVFPDPEVQAVEIFTRYKKSAVVVGWARLRSHSGRRLEDELEKGLYDAIKKEASGSAAMSGVKARARGVLARFVAEYLRRESAWGAPGGFREIVVCFRGDSPVEVTAWLSIKGP